jgi:glyoxylase I family protein
MEQVTGIGGFFFRARDPKALATGIALTWESRWRQEAGPTAFAPFPEDTECFGDGAKPSWHDCRRRT